MPTRKTKYIRGYERGQALVELALILPFLLLLLFGIIEFGRAFFQKNMTINAAREGARRGAVQTTWNPTAIVNFVTYSGAITLQNLRSTARVIPTKTGTQVTVTVTTKFKTVVPKLLIPLENYTSITASATMRYEQ
jgi:Flp pilus assembly protein TadG